MTHKQSEEAILKLLIQHLLKADKVPRATDPRKKKRKKMKR